MFATPDKMPAFTGHRKKKIGQFILKLLGWKLEGEFPNESKLMIAVAPHTSNYDFIIALAIIMATSVKASILMKAEAFIWPFSKLWNWFGFIPINRQAADNFVNQVVSHYDKSERLWVAIAPEGTRSKNERWKTGFLRIAHGANVPIMLLALDYPSKTVTFGKMIQATGDHEKDVKEIRAYFSTFRGRKPHRQG